MVAVQLAGGKYERAHVVDPRLQMQFDITRRRDDDPVIANVESEFERIKQPSELNAGGSGRELASHGPRVAYSGFSKYLGLNVNWGANSAGDVADDFTER